ncbi:MAG TPA: UDP-N-acetylmuramate dehydrogenase [Acidobacteriaceae bacterium]
MTTHADAALAPYTTLGVGGPARWLVETQNEDELLAAVRFARSRSVPFFVMGGGSNLLVSDQGFPGVVVRVLAKAFDLERDGKGVRIRAEAGGGWDAVVTAAVEADAQGIECLAGIPGSVGGTPVQNVGAYGQEVASTIVRVRAIDLESERPVEFTQAECGFTYRQSIFNTTHRGRYAITRVDYALTPGGAPHIEYRDLKQHFAGKGAPTLLETAAAVRAIRARKGMVLSPDDPDSRSAGSFFKNPIVRAEVVRKIAAIKGCKAEEVPQFPAGAAAAPGCVKLSAAWLMELAGFQKGYTMGNAGLSTKHVLAIVNRGGATAAEIVALRDAVVENVRAKTGIGLGQEPVLVGFPRGKDRRA